MKNDRFQMIASEMFDEPKTVSVESGLIIDDASGRSSLTCRWCGLSAFEPTQLGPYTKGVICRGCQSRPVYHFPHEFQTLLEQNPNKLNINCYRCDSCGKWSQVTMTISDVNLWCSGCGRLQLHTRLDPVIVDPRCPKLTDQARKRLDEQVVRAVIETSSREAADPESYRPWFAADSLGGTAITPPTRCGSLLVDDFRVKLGLDDFDDFAIAARKRNAQRVIDGEYAGTDINRRTGRTTRGILEVLARFVDKRAEQLWVRAHSQIYEKDLRKQIRDIINSLKLVVVRDMNIRPLPAGPEPRGVVIFTDHSFTER